MNKPYRTLQGYGSGEIIINKSRFLGHGAPAKTEEEALDFLRQMRERYKDASHNCYAYRIGQNAGIQRYSDDGEPGGTAGLPMMHVLTAQEVVDAIVVVTRYYGGVNLGAGGLVRAYTQGAVLALEAAEVATMHPTNTYLLAAEYPRWGKLERSLAELPVRVLSVEYAQEVVVTLAVRASDAAALLEEIAQATDGKVEPVLAEEGYRGWGQ